MIYKSIDALLRRRFDGSTVEVDESGVGRGSARNAPVPLAACRILSLCPAYVDSWWHKSQTIVQNPLADS